MPSILESRRADTDVAAIVAGEETLFESRRTALTGQKAQLRERVAQLKEEIGGLTAQIDAKGREIALVNTSWKPSRRCGRSTSSPSRS